MGYTEYFKHTTDLPNAKWQLFGNQVQRILNYAQLNDDIKLCRDYDQQDKAPSIGYNDIQFNGVGDEAHEDFHLTRVKDNDFCKTNRKNYTVVVQAVLLAYKMIFRSKVIATSDGGFEDWMDGYKLYCDALGMNAQIFLQVDNGIATLTNKIK
jgi:hypothetical protein